ncbi:50S ribosomal protein L25 [Candidatus Curtissbacteria bacterium]|nr:50S ribosomal protein L25 [Candidatus Curtissbacteria bacterium]
MQQIPLAAQKRTVLGRKVKKLRAEGLIPAHVFGHKIPTIHVQVKGSEFSKVFEEAGETGIIDLAVDGLPGEASAKSGQKRPVLVRNVQIHPVTDQPLHIDFYQVNLTEKVKVNVPLEVTGEAPAVEKKIGLLLTPTAEIEVEALPADLPDKIEVDATKLENIGDEIKVQNLSIDKTKITILTDPDLIVAQIGELVTKEMEAVEAEIAAEKAEAAAAEAPAEGAEVAPAEGAAEGEEAKPEEKPSESKEEVSPEKKKEE